MKAYSTKLWKLIAALAAMLTPAALAQTIDPDKVATIKAAYVLNFIKYTQWPEGTFADSNDPIVLSIVSASANDAVFQTVIKRSDSIGGRRIQLRRVDFPPADDRGRIDPESLSKFFQELEHGHAVYIADASREQVRQMTSHLRGKDVLTMGDTIRFAENGGMLGLVLQEDRVVFQANTGEIQKTRLTVSSKVLKLAQIVETAPG